MVKDNLEKDINPFMKKDFFYFQCKGLLGLGFIKYFFNATALLSNYLLFRLLYGEEEILS